MIAGSNTVIVADCATARNAALAWLQTIPGATVVAFTDHAAGALAAMSQYQVDMLVVDAALPEPTRYVLAHHADVAHVPLQVMHRSSTLR
jgi:DNA-binding NarL/FixJ family response regulator